MAIVLPRIFDVLELGRDSDRDSILFLTERSTGRTDEERSHTSRRNLDKFFLKDNIESSSIIPL